jgi:Na+-translocating ferredoxin:NAD+ oxidoreductase RNF subunit RnfB
MSLAEAIAQTIIGIALGLLLSPYSPTWQVWKEWYCSLLGCKVDGLVTGLPQAHCSRCGWCNPNCSIHKPPQVNTSYFRRSLKG